MTSWPAPTTISSTRARRHVSGPRHADHVRKAAARWSRCSRAKAIVTAVANEAAALELPACAAPIRHATLRGPLQHELAQACALSPGTCSMQVDLPLAISARRLAGCSIAGELIAHPGDDPLLPGDEAGPRSDAGHRSSLRRFSTLNQTLGLATSSDAVTRRAPALPHERGSATGRRAPRRRRCCICGGEGPGHRRQEGRGGPCRIPAPLARGGRAGRRRATLGERRAAGRGAPGRHRGAAGQGPVQHGERPEVRAGPAAAGTRLSRSRSALAVRRS